MDNFILGINVIFPLFFVLMVGYFFRVKNIIDEKFITQSTNIIFYFTMPFSLAIEIKNAEIKGIHYSYILFLLFGVLVMFGLTWFIGKFVIKDKKKLTAFVHCAYRSNFLYIGVPILTAIKPDYDMAPVLAAMVFGITLFNILAIILLTFYSDCEIVVSELLLKIVKNPIIIAIACGILLKYVHIPIPEPFEKGIQVMSKINTPLALIMIGGSLNFHTEKKDLILVMTSALIKNVIGAAVLTPIAYLMGFSTSEVVVAYILFGTPCAINCFVMGKKLGSDELATSQIITASYALSLVTFAGGIAVMKNFGII